MVGGLQQEAHKYKTESSALHYRLSETESRLEQQANTLIVKKTSSTNVAREYENKLEELTEEKENWRDLLYQEKQNHAQTREKCRFISRTAYC